MSTHPVTQPTSPSPAEPVDSSPRPVLQAEELSIRARNGKGIVSDVSLQVCPGEAIAIVGESGSGKSMTARGLTGLLPEGVTSTGQIRIVDQDMSSAGEREWRRIRGKTITWLPQDPFTMLSPLRRAGDSINDGAEGRLTSEGIARRLAEAGVDDSEVASKYPFQLSGGLRQRVGIAAALAADPSVLIADEPSTALDVTTQRRVLQLLTELRQRRDLALILITHDLRVALSVADRVYVMYAGRLLEVAHPDAIAKQPAHPYTQGLLLAEPVVEYRSATLRGIPGQVPTPDEVAQQCAFSTRCAFAIDECFSHRPHLMSVDDDQHTACLRVDELKDELGQQPDPEKGIAGSSDGRQLLLVRDVAKSFAGHQALNGVSVKLVHGEVVGIVGESGSGKTTLARIIAGLETPDSGQVDLDTAGRPPTPANPVQVVFQDPSATLNPSRTVGATLRDALRAGGQAAARDDILALLREVHLTEDYIDRKPSSLSGGQRQRVAIARAIAPGPLVLMCDEPVSALDVSVQAQILELFRELARERELAMLFITHDLGVVRQMADRLYVLRQGSVVEGGETAEVLDNPKNPYTRTLIASVPRADRAWLAGGHSQF